MVRAAGAMPLTEAFMALLLSELHDALTHGDQNTVALKKGWTWVHPYEERMRTNVRDHVT